MTGTACWTLRVPGGATLTLAAGLLRRIEPVAEVVPVPLAPPVVRGIAEAGGRVVTLLDLAADDGARAAAAVEGGLALLLAPPLEHLAVFAPEGTRVDPPGAVPAGDRDASAPWTLARIEALVARACREASRR
ncbi:MAG: hypothetical protein Kow0062_08390 [Acidobacteriota bacterium]